MVKIGLEIFAQRFNSYKDRKIALIANQSSVTSDFIYIWDFLKKNGFNIKRIFSPEHGLFGTEQDQVPVKDQPFPDFDVKSLYGDTVESLTPDRSLLQDIDTVLYDIQDAGARYYTYVNTMVYFMRSISGTDIEFIVLDRPNPLNGVRAEGPVLKKGYESFVGVLPVAARHALTSGELALMAKDIYGLDIDLKIIKMEGWSRNMFFPETGLPWVMPSPNIPSFNTALVYPGMCLLAGLNISEGRGTTVPFEMAGAPFVDPYRLADILNSQCEDSVYYRPLYFIPTFHKYCSRTVGGIFVHVNKPAVFKAFLNGVTLVKAFFDLYEELKFLEDVYEFNSRHPTFDLLAGNSGIRTGIMNGASAEELAGSWRVEEEEYGGKKEKYHLY